MPKSSSTDRVHPARPSALEMFTDRISEQELLARLMSSHTEGEEPISREFITVFYGVGGVGKSTLCRQAMATCREKNPEVGVAMLNLDSAKWMTDTCFAHFLAALVPELRGQKIPCPLTEALLLIYSRAERSAQASVGSSGLWAGALTVLDEAAGAAGIPGIGLIIEGAQWLRDKKRQADTAKRLRDLALWPAEEDGKVDFPDLEKKLAKAMYEDLKNWAIPGKNLRILLDGFERIQSRERRCDCQMLLQSLVGYIAESSDLEMKVRVRILIFGRNKLRWDDLYSDPSWNAFWTQHMLEGLGEDDALEFLGKQANWLNEHGETVTAKAIRDHMEEILDAADEHVGSNRLIYPYYLDLAVDIVSMAAHKRCKPELGKTPSEMHDRFFRYLSPQELHLLKILALAEVFDAPMFDSLVREQRVAGFAIGTFGATVLEGYSYITEGYGGTFRFHRLMGDSLHDLWIKSDVEKKQGGEAVRWLLSHLEQRIGDKSQEDWGGADYEYWRRGVEIIVTNGYERELLSLTDCDETLGKAPWDIGLDPKRNILLISFQERIVGCLERRLGPEHPATLSSIHNLGICLREIYDFEGAERLLRRASQGRENVLGFIDADTLRSTFELANVLVHKGEDDNAAILYSGLLEKIEKVFGWEDMTTWDCYNELTRILSKKGDKTDLEALLRNTLERAVRDLGHGDDNTQIHIDHFAMHISNSGDHEGEEKLWRWALKSAEDSLGPENDWTLAVHQKLADLITFSATYEEKKNGEAEALYRRALLYYERNDAQGYEGEITTLSQNLGILLLRKLGNVKGAEAFLRRAHEGYTKSLGPNHPSTIVSVFPLCDALARLKRTSEAIRIMRNFLALPEIERSKTDNYKKEYIDELAYKLACFECHMGNLDEAKRILSEYLIRYPHKKEDALDEDLLHDIWAWIELL